MESPTTPSRCGRKGTERADLMHEAAGIPREASVLSMVKSGYEESA